MSALSPKVGEVLNLTTFTHVAGNMQVSFKRPSRKGTYVILLLGFEEEGGEPLDLVRRMAELGWKPALKGRLRNQAKGVS